MDFIDRMEKDVAVVRTEALSSELRPMTQEGSGRDVGVIVILSVVFSSSSGGTHPEDKL